VISVVVDLENVFVFRNIFVVVDVLTRTRNVAQNTEKIAVIGGESTSWCVVLQNRKGDCMACIGNMDCHRRISVEMVMFCFFESYTNSRGRLPFVKEGSYATVERDRFALPDSDGKVIWMTTHAFPDACENDCAEIGKKQSARRIRA